MKLHEAVKQVLIGEAQTINLDLNKIKDVELGWNGPSSGYKDPVDAYAVAASYEGRKLTGEELDWLNSEHSGFVYDIAHNAGYLFYDLQFNSS